MKKYIFNIDTTMKKYIFTLIASVMAMTATAQITQQEEREFYQKAYDVIVEYAKSATIENDQQKYNFTRLFESQEARISNDLMVLNNKKDLPLWKYVQELRKADQTEVHVMNLRKESIEDEDSVWSMEVRFDKSISFLNSCFSFFDSNEIFGEPYHMKATLLLDKVTGKCSIRSIVADGSRLEFPAPEDYKILQMRVGEERDKKLDITKNGTKRRVKFNRYDQVFLHTKDKITYKQGPVQEIDLGEECGTKIEVDYKDKTWLVRANFAHSAGGKYDVDKASIVSMSDNSETSYGIDFGYAFKTAGDLKPSLFVGLGMTTRKYTLDLPEKYEEEFSSTEDEDDDSYIRHYKVWGAGKIRQTIEASYLTVPVYADFEYQFTSLLSLYADLGLQFHIMPKWKKNEVQIHEYETWGYYDDYKLEIRNYKEGKNGEPVSVDNPVTLNGFGMITPDKPFDVSANSEPKPKSSINAILGFGARINPSKSFAFDLGLQFRPELSGWKLDSGNLFSYTTANGDNANLLHKVGQIKHSPFCLSASVIYKF